MGRIPNQADELARLERVQARLRSLVRNHAWVGDAIRTAFTEYLALSDTYTRERSELHLRERSLARDLLVRNLLYDPLAKDDGPCLIVSVEGLCPVALAGELAKHGSRRLPKQLEREGAAAALAALDRDTIYQARDLPDRQRTAMAAEFRAAIAAKKHARFTWRVVVARPSNWEEPADPHSLDRADLERFSDADYRTIALYRLGGLADAGALRPIVPRPKSTDDLVHDVGAYAAWRVRFPIDPADREVNHPELDVRIFPAEAAEQMLADVEAWAAREAARRGERLTTNGSEPAATPPTQSPESLLGRSDGSPYAARNDAGSDHGGRPFALTADHERVLRLWKRTPNRCLMVVDLAGMGSIRNRATVGRLCRELASPHAGYLCRPHGKRKGYAPTELGRAYLGGL